MTRTRAILIVAFLAFAAGRVMSGASADVPYAWLALRASAFTSVATPPGAPESRVATEASIWGAPVVARVLPGAPQTAKEGSGSPKRGSTPSGSGTPTHPALVVRGIASWGPFSGHVVTRLPRGTPIVVTGPLGTWRGLSWGYGPAKYTGRIADLDESVFAAICGAPSRGICTVTLSWR